MLVYIQCSQYGMMRISEQSHDTIAHEFVYHAIMLFDDLRNPAENQIECVDDRFFFFIIFHIGSETCNVAKQHGKKTFFISERVTSQSDDFPCSLFHQLWYVIAGNVVDSGFIENGS